MPEARKRAAASPHWLLLLHQLPSGAANARVKVWRRLQQVGAVPLRGAAYVLPDSTDTREDFEWLKSDIAALGGEAAVLAADALDREADARIAAAVRKARRAEYAALGRRIASVAQAAGRRLDPVRLRTLRREIGACRDRLGQLQQVDPYGSAEAETVRRALDSAEARLVRRVAPPRSRGDGGVDRRAYAGRVWQTRPRPGIDRMGSAWLIRRFIDARARFDFADTPKRGAVTFDMFDADFGHDANRCTFETLAERFAIRDGAVARLGAIVHDLDLKLTRRRAPEAAAIGRIVDGYRSMYAADDELIDAGMRLFESLYRSFAVNPEEATTKRGRRKRSRS